MRIIIFGTGYFGKALYHKLSPTHSVVAFASKYIRDGESTLFGVPVLLPGEALRTQIYDTVVIASTTGVEDIFHQCLSWHSGKSDYSLVCPGTYGEPANISAKSCWYTG